MDGNTAIKLWLSFNNEAISRQNDLSDGYETPDLIRGHEIIILGAYMEICLCIPLTWPVLKSDYKPHEFKYANCLITAKKKDDHKPRHKLII